MQFYASVWIQHTLHWFLFNIMTVIRKSFFLILTSQNIIIFGTGRYTHIACLFLAINQINP